MKLLPTFKYLTRDISLLSLPIYYSIILAFTLFIHIMERLGYISNSTVNLGMNSTIIIIVLGLSLTKTEFKMLGQLGISRKTTMIAKGGAIFAISFTITVLDRALDFFSMHVLNSDTLSFRFFDVNILMVYENFIEKSGQVTIEIALLILSFVVRLLIYTSTIFVSMLFIRMSKFLRVVVSIVTGALIFVGTPLFLYYFPSVARKVLKIAAYLFGFVHENPFIAIATLSVMCVVMFGLYALTLRRAPVNV